MREIKFRAWDSKKMVYLAPLEVENQNMGLILSGNIDGKPEAVMQYTGLKDKNGKEIYEGDIVNYGDNFSSLVIWDEFAVRETPGFWLEERGDYGYLRFHTMTAYTNPIEILGNIYENPELLDNK